MGWIGQRLTASGTIVIDNAPIRSDEIEWRNTVEREDAAGRHAATSRELYLAACVAGVVRNVLSDAVEFVRTKARPITHGHADRAVDDVFVQRKAGLTSGNRSLGCPIEVAAERIDLAHDAVSGARPRPTNLPPIPRWRQPKLSRRSAIWRSPPRVEFSTRAVVRRPVEL